MKKLYKKICRALGVLMVYVLLSSCIFDLNVITVTGVSLDTEEVELFVGEKISLTATVYPSNATNQTVLWVSSNPYVASVRDGVVNALKAGTAAIIVTTDDGGETAVCNVCVKENEHDDPDKDENLDKPEVFGPAEVFVANVTATTATFNIHVESPRQDVAPSQVVLYYSDRDKFDLAYAKTISSSDFDDNNDVELKLAGLRHNTDYNYSVLLKINGEEVLSDVFEFKTDAVTLDLTMTGLSFSPSNLMADFTGKVIGLSDEDKNDVEIGVAYYTEKGYLQSGYSNKVAVSDISSANIFSLSIYGLDSDEIYYYCPYVLQEYEYTYGDIHEFDTSHPYTQPSNPNLNSAAAKDLSLYGSANCYIISEPGLYKFKKAKGNSTLSVGEVVTATIMWETFGTDVAPKYNELIKAVEYKDGYIVFQTADVFKEGNALIAVKDSWGDILWSWHIWMTDQPEEQVYHNNSGIVMDRNLGATSATPGDVGALGLLYQWGRKDPFLNSSSIVTNVEAKSTVVWPWSVETGVSNGTIDYTIANPMTFIVGEDNWKYYASTGESLWSRSNDTKSIYDPCPPGWRVSCGGDYTGLWYKALLNYHDDFDFADICDEERRGNNYGKILGSSDVIWYPFNGYRKGSNGSLYDVGTCCTYWTDCTSEYLSSHVLSYGGQLKDKANGQSVRCVKEYSL